MYRLLSVLLLLHITTGSVYNVTPDDHYYPNTTCHYCNNLQYYLLNTTKYFTSNTQLLFLRGLYHLNTDLIIQNVHNISLIGSTTDGTTPDTVIKCNSSVGNAVTYTGIVMTNISNIIMRNMVVNKCTVRENYNTFIILPFKYPSLFLKDCYDVYIHNVVINSTREYTIGLLADNVLGKFFLVRVKSIGVKISYHNERFINWSVSRFHVHLNHKLSIFHFELIPKIRNINQLCKFKHPINTNIFSFPITSQLYFYNSDYEECLRNEDAKDVSYGIKLELYQSSYNVSINLTNTMFKQLYGCQVLSVKIHYCNNIKNVITVKGCHFVDNTANLQGYSMIKISSDICYSKLFQCSGKTEIVIQNCSFINNSYKSALVNITHRVNAITTEQCVKTPNLLLDVHICECLFQTGAKYFVNFHSNDFMQMLLIKKTQFLSSSYMHRALDMINVQLIFKGPILFQKISTKDRLISMTGGNLMIYKHLNMFRIIGKNLISMEEFSSINIMESAVISVSLSHEAYGEMFTTHSNHKEKLAFPLYLPCYFQFYGNHTGSGKNNQIIIIKTDTYQNANYFNSDMRNINCKWHINSSYYGSNPLEVYSQHFKLLTDNRTIPLFDTGLLCICLNGMYPNCYTNTLQSIYPGQTLKLKLSLNARIVKEKHITISVKANDKQTPHSTCKVLSTLEADQDVHKICTEVSYSILSENQQHCKLILYNVNYTYPTVYFIQLLNCPPGFAYYNQQCACDPKLSSGIISMTECDINNQTILRPGNSWLAAAVWNNYYTYKVSMHCPLYYCLPHSLHLDLSNPDSQCQFKRAGILCGHCQQGLSTVFGSAYCQQCSNIYLFLIVPIAIVGLVLVLLLFILNLTVTDGTINAFILYVNIISINTPVFFPQLGKFMPAYTFISLANLDLGVQMCFYNGMDDYAKMWLQLAFPFYLIFIATLLIMTSRYSTTIQRLTARRALPVLATLFLLSYTKLLLIVSGVLFSYSEIFHPPGDHTELVWSVDANVPLFGVKFTTLFVVCFIVFLILLPFNIILLFTRWLSRFTLINKFKPLIDAYQGPYKDRMYYWVGLQLVLRVVLFAVSSLDRNNNLIIGIVLFTLVIGLHSILRPFKNEIKNYQEKFFIMNILILFALALYNHDTTNMTAVNVMIGLSMGHFILIVIYHIITYALSGVTRNKLQLHISTLVERMHKKHHSVQQSRLDSYVKDKIPTAINYHEYREPLIIQD